LRRTITGKTKPEIRKMLVDDHGIHKISIVSNMFGFVVNSYFVEKPCPTLIDVPPDHKIYLEKLQISLKAIGYSLADIKRIITTHPHFDHFGAAQTISELSGAEVWIAHEGAHWFKDFQKEIHVEESARSIFLLESGASENNVKVVDEYYCRATPLARNIEPERMLKEGDLFDLSTFTFTTTRVPGHTPWCALFHDVNMKIAFSGDFLQTISLNPLIQRNPKTLSAYNSLSVYINSLEKVGASGLRITLPGHGEIITDGAERARQLLGLIYERRKTIFDLLEEDEQTPFAISCRLFSDILPGMLFNAISEVSAHLELLEKQGLVRKVGEHPVRFSRLNEQDYNPSQDDINTNS
jgi:glyoxylase-like metal-dependent hydrolase (beta-lactamase superfamily II)